MKDFKVNIGGAWKDTDKMYCKIDGVWKTVEGVWTKIAGVWVECKGVKVFEYIGVAPNLSTGRYNLMSAKVGDYAVFAGGEYWNSSNVIQHSNHVDAYTETLVRTTPTLLQVNQNNGEGISFNDYALFAGGRSGSTALTGSVVGYNASLVRSFPASLSGNRWKLRGAVFGNYVLFAGGATSTASTNTTNIVDAFNMSWVRTSTTLTTARNEHAVAALDTVCFVAGGRGGNMAGDFYDTVETFNTSIVRGTATVLSTARRSLNGASNGMYVLFGGGVGLSGTPKSVDAYNSAGVRTSGNEHNSSKFGYTAASIEDQIIFAGGQFDSAMLTEVEQYNSELVRSVITPLSTARSLLSACVFGNYVFLGGGQTMLTGTSRGSAVVNVYELK